MKLLREVYLMGEMAERVDGAATEPEARCSKNLSSVACYLSAVKALAGLEEVLDFLRYYKPALVEPLQKSCDEFLVIACASDPDHSVLSSLDVVESAEPTKKTCLALLKRAEAESRFLATKIQLREDAKIQARLLAKKLRHMAEMLQAEAKTQPDGEQQADTTPAKQQKDIWEGIAPDMKNAIQDFWKETKLMKTEGKRLKITDFCRAIPHLDETTFRSVKDRVETRKDRPGWADQ